MEQSRPSERAPEGPPIRELKKYWRLMDGVEHRVFKGKIGVKQVYDEMAGDYDDSAYLYWTRRMEKGEERVIGKWIEGARSPIIDVGCGTGRYMMKKAIGGSDVMALDISRRMLGEALEKARRCNGHRNVYPILADGEYLPFRDESFNSLLCALVFDHFNEPELAAYEFWRVLKYGGLCIMTTFNPDVLNDWKRRAKIPLDKIRFQTENMLPTLIYEVGHSVDDVKDLFCNNFDIMDAKGCCYWHLLPSTLIKHYRLVFDSFFNLFKHLLKYAEIHVVSMKKRKAGDVQKLNR